MDHPIDWIEETHDTFYRPLQSCSAEPNIKHFTATRSGGGAWKISVIWIVEDTLTDHTPAKKLLWEPWRKAGEKHARAGKGKPL